MTYKIVKLAYLFLILVFAAYSAYSTYFLYYFWNSHDLSKYYLPPYQSIFYFIQYAFFRFWSHFLAALLFSLIILFLTKYFNKKHGEKYFWPEEPYYIALAILAVGYPGWVIYFSLLLLVPLFFSAVCVFFLGRQERISYYYLWLPLAVFTILINKWLATFPFWSKLII